jgi:hypothetical protein
MKRVVADEKSRGQIGRTAGHRDVEVVQDVVEEPAAIERVGALIEVVSRDVSCPRAPAKPR